MHASSAEWSFKKGKRNGILSHTYEQFLSEALITKKERKKKRGRNFLWGLCCYYVDGVCEGVHACYVLVHIDGDSDSLRCVWLKYGA